MRGIPRILVFALLVSVSLVPMVRDANLVKPHVTANESLGNPPVVYSATIADYDEFSVGNFTGAEFSHLNLSVKLNEVESTVEGNLTVDFYNDDPVPFSRIPFHLYPSGMLYDSRPGNITILNVTTTGEPAQEMPYSVLWEQQLMWVNLTETLQPGERTEFHIEFITTLPDGLDRANAYGEDGDQSRIYTVSSSYPIPCVHDKFDGWNTDPYVGFGDPFYIDMAFYEFYLNAPNGMIVAATGELIESDSNGESTTYHFDPVLPVREITFSASRYYQVESANVDGVIVSSFYLPNSQTEWEDDVLEWTSLTLSLLNETYGVYPYSTLNVVEQHGFYGGMEYPCQVYMTREVLESVRAETLYPEFLELVVVHEVAHQWWSQLVGDDCIDWGFLDEGLTCWSHNYYGEVYYSDWEYLQYYRYLDTVRLHHEESGAGSIINQSNYERPELVGYIDYTKAPLILEKLRIEIGHEKFVESLSYFFKQNYFEIATLPDLQEAFEFVCGENMDWFFLPWFDNPFLPDYSFTGVVYNLTDGTVTISVEDLNEVSNPYPYSQQVLVRVVNDFGGVLLEEMVWINGTTIFSRSVSTRPSEVCLDYEDYVLVDLISYDVDSLSTRDIQVVGTPSLTNLWGFIPMELLPVIAVTGIVLILVFYVLVNRRSRNATW